MFVVHQHDATRMHWDLRLEIDGVLCSWAVPKAPSMDPDDKRLAVKVENHPLEYVHFEAVIPRWQLRRRPDDRVGPRPVPAARSIRRRAWRDGEIKFELYGYKLRGAFTLVHTGKGKRGKQLGARLERLAPDQEARRARAAVPRRWRAAIRRERAVGPDDRRARARARRATASW